MIILQKPFRTNTMTHNEITYNVHVQKSNASIKYKNGSTGLGAGASRVTQECAKGRKAKILMLYFNIHELINAISILSKLSRSRFNVHELVNFI